MSETVFRHIDAAVDSALESTPRAEALVVREEINGFPVSRKETPEEVEARTRVLMSPVASLHKARADMRAELTSKGLPPLAVLPAGAWADITRAHGLFRFESMFRGSRTRYDTDSLGALADLLGLGGVIFTMCAAVLGVWAYAIGATLSQVLPAYAILGVGVTCGGVLLSRTYSASLCLFIAMFCAPFLAQQALIGWQMSWGTVLNLVLTFVEFAACSFSTNWLDQEGWFAKIPNLFPRRMLMRRMWPQGVDVGAGSVGISFPEPPPAFADKLRVAREHGVHLCVAAVPEAVSIDMEDLRKSMAERADPIIYTMHHRDGHDLVAIIDQFGDFPDEKRLMKTLSEVNFLAYR